MSEASNTTWLKLLRALPHETPFMLLDPSQARENVLRLKELLPDVGLYYAVKSNDDPRLIRAIDTAVDGYEVASKTELQNLQALGIAGNRVLFSNPVKIPSHVQVAYNAGVRAYAFDTLLEVEKLSKFAPGSTVFARVKVSDESSSFPLSRKFGAEPDDVVAYMRKAALLGLAPKGLAFNVGSQSHSPDPWTTALRVSGKLIQRLAQDGIKVEFLDIGGGFPAIYDQDTPDIGPIAQAINDGIKRYIPARVRVFAEPGRFISASSAVIAESVIGRETRSKGQEWLFLDMGAFQGMIEPLEAPSWRYPVFTDYDRRTQARTSYVLTGPSCDACDTIGFGYILPATLKPGDRVYIGAAGAYTRVYGSGFNGFAPPKVYYVEN